MTTLNLRARFPDGRAITLSQLPETTLYKDLLSQIQARADLPSPLQKVTLAGPPRRELTPADDSTIGTILKSGDSLIVEPVAHPSSTLRPRRRARPRAIPAQPNDDDQADADWNGDDEPAARPRAKRRKAGFQGRGYRLDGEEVVSTKKAKAKKKEEVDIGNASLPDMTGALGGQIVKSLLKKPEELDVTGKKFREALQGALAQRIAEAEAERRVEAVLAGRYEITDLPGGLFSVKYRTLNQRAWTEENEGGEMMEYPRELLAAAFRQVVDSGVADDIEGLRMRNMAMVSVRSFWNMVKLFGKDTEDGLKDLVPEADWSFLYSRRRGQSKKGKRNDEMKAEMGWSSD